MLPGVQHRDGALGEDAADDNGLPQSAGSRLTQRDQDSCRREIHHSFITADSFVNTVRSGVHSSPEGARVISAQSHLIPLSSLSSDCAGLLTSAGETEDPCVKD